MPRLRLGLASPGGAAVEPRRPGRPRDSRCDRAILEATLALVSSEGLVGFTVDAVAAAAGVSKATIYRRWSSKEAMVLDAWRELSQPVTVPDTGSLRGDLIALYAPFADRISRGPLAGVLPQMVASAQVDPQLGREYRAFLAERRRPLRIVLERAVGRGELTDGVEPELVQELVAGPLYYRVVIAARPLPAGYVERLVDLAVTGLRDGGSG